MFTIKKNIHTLHLISITFARENPKLAYQNVVFNFLSHPILNVYTHLKPRVVIFTSKLPMGLHMNAIHIVTYIMFFLVCLLLGLLVIQKQFLSLSVFVGDELGYGLYD